MQLIEQWILEIETEMKDLKKKKIMKRQLL